MATQVEHPKTEEEIKAEEEELKVLENIRKVIGPTIPPALLRAKRNSLLAETDWWASSDLTMTADQTAYRQALRDLPSSASPSLDEYGQLTGVTWPTKPE